LGGISSEFSSIPVTSRRYPDNEQKNSDPQFAPKNGQKPKPSMTRPIAGRQKPSPAAAVVFLLSERLPGKGSIARVEMEIGKAYCDRYSQ
jgi:hypothetical protein